MGEGVFFFFQAEDGIRDYDVTGVQTCALPISFDSHFVKRGRFSRLFQAVAMNPVCLGIGLGEDTGLLITEGHKMEAIGSGLVIIVDGKNIRYTNVASIDDKEPISIENLSVHILVQNNGFLLNDRKFLASY